MNLYKLKVSGDDTAFIVQYSFSKNFLDYQDCDFKGTEDQKYIQFLEDLRKNGGMQPINIKMKMSSKTVDRAMTKNKLLLIPDVYQLIEKLGQ